MKRSITCLTLTLSLTIAHSAHAFPHFTTFDGIVANQSDPADSTSALLDGVATEELIAIIALSQTAESGMDDIAGMLHAYNSLLEMGFSAEEAAFILIPPDSGSQNGNPGGSGGMNLTSRTQGAVDNHQGLTQPHYYQ